MTMLYNKYGISTFVRVIASDDFTPLLLESKYFLENTFEKSSNLAIFSKMPSMINHF